MAMMLLIATNLGAWWWLTGLSVGLVLGHNMWLIAERRRRESGGGAAPDSTGDYLRCALSTGHYFPVSESAVRPERVADWRVISARGGAATIADVARIEDQELIAESDEISSATAFVAAVTLRPHPITLEADKFRGYIADEDAAPFVAPVFSADTAAPQSEVYSKYAKAHVAAAAADGAEELVRQPIGHDLEIVFDEGAPTERTRAEVLSARVLFAGRPLAGVRVSSGCEQINRGTYLSHARTDARGRAVIVSPAQAGRWYLRTHYIRPHPDRSVAAWESFWASFTFRVY